MEIAVTRKLQEVVKILAEFAELTDKEKLLQMSFLMNSDNPKKTKAEFQSVLESLPVDLVRISFRTIFTFVFLSSGEHCKCPRRRDTFAECCLRGKKRLC